MSSLDRLYRDVENLKQQYKGLAGGPQLALSSIENGAIDSMDADGNLKMTIGLQDDGGNTIKVVDTPTPPQPTQAQLAVDGPVITAVWDGAFTDADEVPTYFEHVLVTASHESGQTQHGTIAPGATSRAAVMVVPVSGVWTVTFTSVSQSGKVSEPSAPAVAEVTLVDLAGAIEAVQNSANGKNKITWSLRAPTSADPGTIGDIWWVNEARTHEDGSAYLAIIAQYQYQSGGWVQVELAHEVIASVDLGTATVGELDGIRITSKTVGTEQLRADFADFMVSRNGTVIAGDNRVRLDNNGFAVFNEDGETRTQITPEGTTVKGDLEAETLVATGPAEFRSTENRLGQGAKLTLEAGVTDPTAPPVVQPFWDGLEFDPPAGFNAAGLAFDGTNYWTADAWPAVSTGRKINPTTGVVSRVDIPAQGRVFGVTCIGSELFWLTVSGYTSKVIVTDLSGAKKREWEYPIGYTSTNPLKYMPGIGNNGTDVVIAQCTDAGVLAWYTFNKTTGALLITTVSESTSTNSDIAGIYVGPGDWGSGNRVVVAKTSTRSLLTYSTSGVWDSARSWSMAAGGQDTGVVFAGGKFRTLNASGVIHEYADQITGDDSGDWWAAYQWASFDDDTDTVIDKWSRISPPKRFAWPRRSQVKAIGAPLPAGVGFIGPALAKKATTPTRTDFHQPSWNIREGESVAWYDELPANWATGTVPRDENNFPNATPSTLVSASNTFEVKGDGTGRWGPLTFNTNGTVTGIARTASGQLTHGNVTALGGLSFSVTLPPGVFTTPPNVVAGSGQGWLIALAKNITTTSFTCEVHNSRNTAITGTYPINWIARADA